MSNRVEELEEQLAELRAAVNGLTEELVETKSRVKDLEEAAAEQPAPAVEPEPTDSTSVQTTKSDDHVEVVTHERTDTAASAAPTDESATDDAAAETEATESDTLEGDEAADETAEGPEQNEIIVA
jgi:uncharacterized coiled-coil protein SlyX